jgi:hypothetical protein
MAPPSFQRKREKLNNRVWPISNRPMKDKIALIGFAPTTRDLVPWDDPEMDFFSINERYNVPDDKKFDLNKITAHLQIHPHANFMRAGNPGDPQHPQWLREPHPFPIFTQRKYPDVPSSVAFPLEACNQFLRLPGAGYYMSSLAYQLALALVLGFKRIELYGYEMASDTEYYKQRPNAEYIIGYGRALGYDIYLPPGCPLCWGPVYGYKSMDTPYRQQLEFNRHFIENGTNKYMGEFNEALGRTRMVRELKDMTPEERLAIDWQKKYDDEKAIAEQHKAELNVTLGAAQNNKWALDQYDTHRYSEGVNDDDRTNEESFKPGEGLGAEFEQEIRDIKLYSQSVG